MSLLLVPKAALPAGALDDARVLALADELNQVARAPREKLEMRVQDFAPELLDVTSWCEGADPDDLLLRVLVEPGFAGALAEALQDLAERVEARRKEGP